MALATLGVVVPGIAAFYEFVVKGRKRLGYRVQMDTTATNVVETDDPGVFDQLREPLVDPTLVLLRIENNGQTHIDEDDYAVLHDKKAGVTVTFPDRKVVGMVVTELSDDGMRSSFEGGAGLAVRGNRILLPKVPRRSPRSPTTPRRPIRTCAPSDVQLRHAWQRRGAAVPRPGRPRSQVGRGAADGGVDPGRDGVQRAGRRHRPSRADRDPDRRHPATVDEADHGTYPFWETEFGYTAGEPGAGSPAASFLRYLTNQVGADIIRSHGDRPCAELANPGSAARRDRQFGLPSSRAGGWSPYWPERPLYR